MSSFKTQTGPGTIYDQLIHPPTDSANPDSGDREPSHQDLAPDKVKPVNQVATGSEAEVSSESETTEREPTVFSSTSGDPGS